MSDRELIIVGGGAAGLAAARTAVSRGVRPLIVTSGPLGGECTHTGCIPSKALIWAARRGLDYSGARAHVADAIARIARTEDGAALATERIDVLHGHARLLGARLIEADGTRIWARRIILATGSRPIVPEIPGLAAAGYLTNDSVFTLDALPARLAVLGGGAIGCELAQAFARLGVDVVLIEAGVRLLAREEPEASRVIADALADDGVTVRTASTVTGVRTGPDGATLEIAGGPPVTVNRILVAVGRRPNTEGLELERAGVRVAASGAVVTDAGLATSLAGVFAAGDVTGVLPLTHVADEMGRLAARNALARRPRHRFDPEAIPVVTFTEPEIARVGLTEQLAERRGGTRVAYLPAADIDRAIVDADPRGFVKLIAADRRVLRGLGGGRLVGATVVAARGGEIIHEAALAMQTQMFVGRIAQTVHAYPTWSVAMRMAAAQFVTTVGGRTARPAQAGS